MFYRGKHVAKRSPFARFNKSTMLLVSLVLILTLTVGSTVTFLIDVTSEVKNVFNPITVNPPIEETFNNQTKSNVTIKNDNSAGNAVDVFIRVNVVETWTDGNGNVVQKIDGDIVTINIAEDDTDVAGKWVKSDDYYYFTQPVAPGASTDILISTATYSSTNGHSLRLDIMSQAIQAEPVSAVVDAWGVNPTTLDS